MNGTPLVDLLISTASSVALAIGPLAALFVIMQVFVLGLPQREIARIVIGTLLASAGLFLFLLGASIGFLPFGRSIGEALGAQSSKWLLAIAGLMLGFVTTWGEPAVRILADQVDEASSGSIPRTLVLYVVASGVGIAVSAGMLRVGYDIPLLYFIVPGYAFVLATMWIADRTFVSIAIDAGGVATGPLANTFLLALAIGAAAGMGRENPLVTGLGLVSLIAIAPVISLVVTGLLIRFKERKEYRTWRTPL